MKSIAVLGLGKVGRLAAQLLVDSDFDVLGVDSAAKSDTFSHEVSNIDVTDASSLGTVLNRVDAVLSCLPYHLNIGVSNVAHAAGRFDGSAMRLGSGFCRNCWCGFNCEV